MALGMTKAKAPTISLSELNSSAVYHDILEFSARVLVTGVGIEFLNGPTGPTISSTSDEFTSTRERSLG